jgi:hypothetical protein
MGIERLHVWFPNPQEQPRDRLLRMQFQRTHSRLRSYLPGRRNAFWPRRRDGR